MRLLVFSYKINYVADSAIQRKAYFCQSFKRNALAASHFGDNVRAEPGSFLKILFLQLQVYKKVPQLVVRKHISVIHFDSPCIASAIAWCSLYHIRSAFAILFPHFARFYLKKLIFANRSKMFK